jgi:hypothetical protein
MQVCGMKISCFVLIRSLLKKLIYRGKMAKPAVKERRIVWKIENFTKKLNMYNKDKDIESNKFSILLGRNETTW